MANRQNISSGSPFEPTIGFSRAVRIGNVIAVSGTVATDADGKPVSDDIYEQARFCFQRIVDALAAAGASESDVIRTRMLSPTFAPRPTPWGGRTGSFFGMCGRRRPC